MKKIASLFVLCFFWASFVQAQSEVTITPGADLVSRYLWRGQLLADAPSIQPALNFAYQGFTLGFWGSYCFSNQEKAPTELDFLLGYTHSMGDGMSLNLTLTDFYYPDAGKRMGNFNNYDDTSGPGAHLIEASVKFTGPSSVPLYALGAFNIYNDAGSNAYVEVGYSTAVQGVTFDAFIGAALGSKDNPAYYGSEDFNLVSVGCTATKVVKVSESFSIPVFVQYVLNPRIEKSFLVLGIKL